MEFTERHDFAGGTVNMTLYGLPDEDYETFKERVGDAQTAIRHLVATGTDCKPRRHTWEDEPFFGGKRAEPPPPEPEPEPEIREYVAVEAPSPFD